MSLVDLREQSASTLRFFAPATDDEISGVNSRFPGFKLAAYTSVLAQSNGVGELFCEGQHSFIHNMLLFSAVDALDWSARAFADRFLVIGAPGVDGAFYVLKRDSEAVLAHMSYDHEFVFVANSAVDLLWRWHRNELAPL